MKEDKNFDQIFDKLDRLRNLFDFGEKIVPITQNLVDFLKEIIFLLENINELINESQTQIPRATDKINSVTNATEIATTEILDLVDQITEELNSVEESINGIIANREHKDALYNKLCEILKENADAKKLLDEYHKLNYYVEIFNQLKKKISTVEEFVFKITMSLQVQDITAQQLSSVNHIIESVHNRLSFLVTSVDNEQVDKDLDKMKKMMSKVTSFDPDAIYDQSSSRQDEVDSIINAMQNDKQNK